MAHWRLKKRVLDQEALEYLKGSTPGVFDNIPGGTQAERDRNIFCNEAPMEALCGRNVSS